MEKAARKHMRAQIGTSVYLNPTKKTRDRKKNRGGEEKGGGIGRFINSLKNTLKTTTIVAKLNQGTRKKWEINTKDPPGR